MEARTYKATISGISYKEGELAQEHEMYITATRSGDVRRIRRNIAETYVPFFQRDVYRRHKRWIPKRKIRVSFEREELAKKAERDVKIDSMRIELKGRRRKAYPLPSRVRCYGKKSLRRRKRR